jgi:hypothetical protein
MELAACVFRKLDPKFQPNGGNDFPSRWLRVRFRRPRFRSNLPAFGGCYINLQHDPTVKLRRALLGITPLQDRDERKPNDD